MRRPTLYLTLAVGLALLVSIIERPGRVPGEAATGQQLFRLLDPAKVARIEVERLLDGVELVREQTGWSVRPFETAMRTQVKAQEEEKQSVTVEQVPALAPADPEKVQESLEAWQRLQATSLVSTNPQHQALYQVNQMGLHIRAYDHAGQLLAEAHVGKQGPDFFSTYIRRAGEDSVYLTRESLQGHFSTQVEHWLPKQTPMPVWLKRAATPRME